MIPTPASNRSWKMRAAGMSNKLEHPNFFHIVSGQSERIFTCKLCEKKTSESRFTGHLDEVICERDGQVQVHQHHSKSEFPSAIRLLRNAHMELQRFMRLSYWLKRAELVWDCGTGLFKVAEVRDPWKLTVPRRMCPNLERLAFRKRHN